MSKEMKCEHTFTHSNGVTVRCRKPAAKGKNKCNKHSWGSAWRGTYMVHKKPENWDD